MDIDCTEHNKIKTKKIKPDIHPTIWLNQWWEKLKALCLSEQALQICLRVI